MKKQHGFTLIEIAIVMVIIGLLLGGVLKGQELIVQARIKNIINDLTALRALFIRIKSATAPTRAMIRRRAVGQAWARATETRLWKTAKSRFFGNICANRDF